MSKIKNAKDTAMQIEPSINEWEAIGLSKAAWDDCIKKGKVLTLKETTKVVEALDEGDGHALYFGLDWNYIDPSALTVLDKWVDVNSNDPGCLGLISLKNASDYCIARLANLSIKGFKFHNLDADIQRRVNNAKAKLRRAAQPPKIKADLTAPLPSAPTEWHNGRIVLAAPAKPLSGHGHERVRWLGPDCPREEKPARKWFFEVLRAGLEHDQSGHADRVTSGSSRPLFVSPEAFQLWKRHTAFWMAESLALKQRAKAEKAAGEKKLRTQANATMAAAANDSGLTVTALRSKLKTLQTMMAESGTLPLVLELLRAAEAPLLRAVLQGASIRREKRRAGSHEGRSIEVNTGTVFGNAYGGNLPFWLAAVRSSSAARPALKLGDVFTIELEASSEAELEAITADILPHLTGLEQLTLTVKLPVFSTKVLPSMPKLSRLILEGEGNLLRLEDLDRQSALVWCVIQGREPVTLEIAEKAEPVFQRIRLDLSQGSHSTNHEGLRNDNEPPEHYGCLKGMNLVAARVLLAMVLDYSQHPAPPQWWRSFWALPDVPSKVSGRISNFTWPGQGPLPAGHYAMEVEEAGTKKRHRHLIPLGRDHQGGGSFVTAGEPLATRPAVRYVNCSNDSLKPDPAHVAIWAASEAALSFTADKLDIETAKLLVPHRGPLRLQGAITLDVLPLLMQFRGELTLDLDGLTQPSAKILSNFAGSKLSLVTGSGSLDKAVAAGLAAVGVELLMDSTDTHQYHDGLSIPLAAAVALAKHRHKLTFVGPGFCMEAASVAALMTHPDCDLGCYRPRRFERPDGKGIRFWEVQPEGHMARISHGVVGGAAKQSLKKLSRYSGSRREQVAKLVGERFENGFTEVAFKKGVSV